MELFSHGICVAVGFVVGVIVMGLKEASGGDGK